MPELPEVETVRRGIELAVVGKRIARAELIRRDMLVVPGDPEGGFSRQRAAPVPKRFTRAHILLGGTVESVRRHGKQLAIVTSDHRTLLVHLGMSGSVRVLAPDDATTPMPPHTHASWVLEDGTRLLYVDPRRFGLLRALRAGELPESVWSGLGPDALGITAPVLRDRLSGVNRPIKAALLDQRVIAGVGNIYADEALHKAGLHPLTSASDSAPAAKPLAGALRSILAQAVRAGGSTIRTYTTASGGSGGYQLKHSVYGRADKPCRACGTPLVSDTIAQRTTVWCPVCQSNLNRG